MDDAKDRNDLEGTTGGNIFEVIEKERGPAPENAFVQEELESAGSG